MSNVSLLLETNDTLKEKFKTREIYLLHKMIIKYKINFPVTVNTLFHTEYNLCNITKNDDNTFTISKDNFKEKTTSDNTIKLKYEDEIKNFKNQIDKLTIEINTLEIKFDQANRLKIQTQKNQYERPIKLLEIDIDSKDKSIKDIVRV